jgi:hypothetical protein
VRDRAVPAGVPSRVADPDRRCRDDAAWQHADRPRLGHQRTDRHAAIRRRLVRGHVEFCLAPSIQSSVPASTIRGELALVLTDGRTIAPDTGPGASDEVFLSNQAMKGSDCVRGPLVFAVPLDGIPQFLQLVGPLGGMRWRVT